MCIQCRMGYDCATLTIRASLDRHGDDRQDRDARLWDELLEEVRKIVRQEKYDPIRPTRDF